MNEVTQNITEEALKTLNILHDPGELFEIIVKDAQGRWKHGFFDRPILGYNALCALGNWSSAYVTLNPVDSRFKPMALVNPERLEPIDFNGTRDSDILYRKWLFVDIDTRDTSEDAKNNVKVLSSLIHMYCKGELGMPDPDIIADSGTGIHMLWKHTVTTDEYRKFLKILADVCNSSVFFIDQSVFNPARIVKIYGTSATKNDVTRMSRLISTGF